VFEYKEEDGFIVIQATSVLSVVTMVPFGEGHLSRFFLVEKFSLGVVDTGIILEQMILYTTGLHKIVFYREPTKV
jgi:hypothetical protein